MEDVEIYICKTGVRFESTRARLDLSRVELKLFTKLFEVSLLERNQFESEFEFESSLKLSSVLYPNKKDYNDIVLVCIS